MTKTLGTILKEAPLNKGFTQQQVADKANISHSHYNQTENEKARLPSFYVLEQIAFALGLKYPPLRKLPQAMQLGYKQHQLDKQKSRLGIKGSSGPREHRIPIFNEIPADIPNNMTDFDFPPGIAEDYVDRYLDNFTTTDPSTYAVRVGADCMEPKLEKGDIVLLSRTKEWHSGDIVAVRWSDGEKKELRRIIKQDDHIILQPENPKYNPIVLNKKDKPETMGVFTMLIRIPRK